MKNEIQQRSQELNFLSNSIQNSAILGYFHLENMLKSIYG